MKVSFLNRMLWILAAVLVILLLLSAGLTAAVKLRNPGMQRGFSNSRRDDSCGIYEVSAKHIGNSYRGEQASEGYSYYLIFLHVNNQGNSSKSVNNLGFYPEGEYYDDIIDGGYVSDKEETSDFEYENTPIVPAGEDAVVSYYLQVKNGVKKIYAACYGEDSFEDGAKMEIRL